MTRRNPQSKQLLGALPRQPGQGPLPVSGTWEILLEPSDHGEAECLRGNGVRWGPEWRLEAGRGDQALPGDTYSRLGPEGWGAVCKGLLESIGCE